MFSDLFDKQDKPYENYAKDAISNIFTPNTLADLFFSNENVAALQLGIKNLVYKKSNDNYVVGDQNSTELRVIMKSIYLEHGQHSLDKRTILNETKRLNVLVLDFCVPRIITEINMYIYYKNDVNHIADPIDRGQFSSNKGTRYLEIKEF